MKIKRFVLTVAVSDAEAEGFTSRVVGDISHDGLDLVPGTGANVVAFVDERTVDYPDYDEERDGPAAGIAWLKRSAIEIFKA